ncbi:hypothetical protein [Natrinema marinum]|uniref:hypothetical protein n=1 Tax=Natrinema marinum TaxID=2961598 RepID=UPI0020C85C71|nr:hypothetical protein [Natrinema marinum]
MATRTDALLTVVVLVVVTVAYAVVDASLSVPFLAGGAVGTLAFELVTARHREAVRRRWERPSVQAVTLAVALAGIAIGARVAPARVLSFALGSLVAYLVFLLGVAVSR